MYKSAKTFEELELSPELLQGLYTEMKFEKPSRIQAETLPMMLAPPHRHLIAQVRAHCTVPIPTSAASRAKLKERAPPLPTTQNITRGKFSTATLSSYYWFWAQRPIEIDSLTGRLIVAPVRVRSAYLQHFLH